MRQLITVWLAFAVVGALTIVSFGASPISQDSGPNRALAPNYESPRLNRLAKELESTREEQEPLSRFWKELQGKAPLLERIPGNDRELLVTFFWHGNQDTRRVSLLGDNPSPDSSEQEIKRFGNTALWYKTEKMPSDARFGYAISENGKGYKPDPLNPTIFAGRSVAELPNAPKELWIKKISNIPAGTLSKHKIRSELLKEERSIGVYVPANYNEQGEPYSLLVVFDGESYGNRPESAISMPTILDNLSASKKIPPLVAVLVDSQGTRERDLVCSDGFSAFLANELVPWCRQKYHLGRDPSRVIAAGSSYGGLCAAYTAFRHSDVFGNALSLSGTFSYFPNWKQKKITDYSDETGWLTRQLAIHAKLPIRFYLAVGRFEGGPYWSLLRENRHLRNVLEAKGYSLSYSEYSGGHDYVSWRSSIAHGLIVIFGDSNQRP